MCFMKFMADWGIWDIIGLLAAIAPTVIVLLYVFPRKKIKNLYVDTRIGSVNEAYPKVIQIELRNRTNEPFYIVSEGFVFGKTVRPAANGAKDAATETYEVKFMGPQPPLLTEIDTLVRPRQGVSTWVPVDPSQSNQGIETALSKKDIGTLRLVCQRVSNRRHAPVKLKIPV